MAGRRYLADHYSPGLVGSRNDKIIGIYIEIAHLLLPDSRHEVAPGSRQASLLIAPTATSHSAH